MDAWRHDMYTYVALTERQLQQPNNLCKRLVERTLEVEVVARRVGNVWTSSEGSSPDTQQSCFYRGRARTGATAACTSRTIVVGKYRSVVMTSSTRPSILQ